MIAAREKELLEIAGIDNDMKLRFIDEPDAAQNVVMLINKPANKPPTKKE